MAKDKYVSKGIHSTTSAKTLNAIRKNYRNSAERVINQLKAFRAGKRVVIKTYDEDGRLKKVDAKEVWKNASGEGYVQ